MTDFFSSASRRHSGKKLAMATLLETEEVTELDEEKLRGAVGGAGLVEDGRCREGLVVERKIAETVVVADVESRAGVEEVGEEDVGRELFGGRDGAAGVAAEIGLKIKQLVVRKGGVVIEDDAEG